MLLPLNHFLISKETMITVSQAQDGSLRSASLPVSEMMKTGRQNKTASTVL